MANNNIFIKKLKASGLRPTMQRINICKILFDRNTTFHFTINDLTKIIEDKLKKKNFVSNSL